MELVGCLGFIAGLTLLSALKAKSPLILAMTARSFIGRGPDFIQGWTEPGHPSLLLQNVDFTVSGALDVTARLTRMRTRPLQPTPGPARS